MKNSICRSRSEITWNEGKDVTKKVIKKKQKKGSGAGKFVTKTVKNDSFFNFFDPIVIPEKEKGKEVTDDVSFLRVI